MQVSEARSTPKCRSDNRQALCVLDSNLTACKIPHTILDGKSGVDLEIQHKGGGISNVVVVVDLLAPVAPNVQIVVLVDEILHLDRAANLEAFWEITQKTGWGKPMPVDRGVAPKGKIKDVTLLVIRHTEYRQAPDLSTEVMAKLYDPTIRNFARALFRNPATREVLCDANEDFVSLCQIGRVIATNFNHRFRDVRGTEACRVEFFSAHLKQRYQNAIQQWRKQAANAFPDDQTLSIAMTGELGAQAESYDPTVAKPVDHSYLLDLSKTEVNALSPVLQKVRGKLLLKRDEAAKIRATQPTLADVLRNLSHDNRIVLLTGVATRGSRYVDPVARALAEKTLDGERAKCADPTCIHQCQQQVLTTPLELGVKVEQ